MRKTFANLLHQEMEQNDKIIVLSGDLGYGMWDAIRRDYPNRFWNIGSSEMLLIGAAIGLHYEGYIPICYSITPFLIYRPFELLRTYVDYENIPIKLVGSGVNDDYKHDGISHWAWDVKQYLNQFSFLDNCFPDTMDEIKSSFKSFLYSKHPEIMVLRKHPKQRT